MYGALALIRFSSPSIESLRNDLSKPKESVVGSATNAATFESAISFKNVCISYPDHPEKMVISNFSGVISKGSHVGFVGSTGSGKTTLVDAVAGLVGLQTGNINIDGVNLNCIDNRGWQSQIGYVPQDSFLVDDTIAGNVAFGISPSEIDFSQVEAVLRTVSLDEFVAELPSKWLTFVGEGGAKLSGGQKQRICIARALYRNPNLLILDEATSALDTITEDKVMNRLLAPGNGITVINIAHRLRTVKRCDNIFLFEKGVLKAEGDFNTLSSNSELFGRLIG